MAKKRSISQGLSTVDQSVKPDTPDACAVDWCAALPALDKEGKPRACCVVHHKHGRHLHPAQYKYKPRPQTGRPWDDERPWWERQEYV